MRVSQAGDEGEDRDAGARMRKHETRRKAPQINPAQIRYIVDFHNKNGRVSQERMTNIVEMKAMTDLPQWWTVEEIFTGKYIAYRTGLQT